MISRSRPTPDQAQRLLKDVYAPIAAELVEAEEIFATELGSRLQVVQHLVDHCAHLRGKRLRPALLLLTAQACGGTRPDHLVLAAVVEMIHTATLVHDDVLDDALIRRHAATVNAECGQ
jgi:octaprenyl-diphosphate synthase